jgi:phospholipid/cholesterol/gamma-HCH transport system ATP-binding protein
MNPASLLQVEGLRKSFGGRPVLEGVDLAVPRGSIFTVLGPSGAGKSVFLKCVAHVVPPDAGHIRFNGSALDPADAAAHARFLRRCSFLFQSNALFDSLTALENVALPLEQTTDLTDREIRERSIEALRQLDIEAHAARYPGQLSGGMQKRVALARAIVTHPELVLFDEPTAGLDPIRRNNVFAMIAHYQHKFNFTALIVTHDVPEALVTSDRVALLDKGRICFEGTPAEFSASSEPTVHAFRDNTEALRRSLAAIRRKTASV